LLLFFIAIASARKNRLISFCILWFLGNLVIESSVIGLEIIFEHRNYLPSMMAVLLIVMPIFLHIQKPSWLRIAILCFIVIVLSFWTYERNRVWSDRISLWGDAVAKSPQKARPHNNLGVALKDKGITNEAVKHFQETIRLDPEFTEAYNNLGNTYMLIGKHEDAIKSYYGALKINPNYATVHANLGKALVSRWRLDEAMYHYREVLRLQPYDQEARMNLLSVQQMLNAQRLRKK
jgi:tetratricopeptide (TPR) repeat protein